MGAAAYLAFSRNSGASLESGSLQDLEARIATGESAEPLWLAYAQRLEESKRFADAARAYQNILDKDPDHRRAAMGKSISLASANLPDDLHAHLSDLALNDPKLVLDLLDRPDFHPYLSDDRFKKLQKESRAQAMD